MKKKKRIDLLPYLLLVPSMIFLVGITLYPFVTSIYYSFFDYSFTKTGINFVGLENYIDILSEGKFFEALSFTLLYTVFDLAIVLLLGFITSVLMRQKFVGKQVLKATMLIPWILPQVVTGYVFNLMIAQNMGILNRIMALMGLVPVDFSWFTNPVNATIAVVMASSWRGFPFVALMLYSKMQSVPVDLLEAASLDGANSVQRFTNIVVPHIKQIFLTCAFLTFLWTFNAFDIIKVMTNGGPLEKTVTLSFLLQREAFRYLKIGRSCAMAVLMFLSLITIIAIVFAVKWLVEKGVAKYEQKQNVRKAHI